jgi:toxin FitB
MSLRYSKRPSIFARACAGRQKYGRAFRPPPWTQSGFRARQRPGAGYRIVNGYLVDTNIPSELTRDTPDARVAAFLENAGKESALSQRDDCWRNLQRHLLAPASQKRSALQDDVRSWFAGRILPVTESIAERWGRLAAGGKRNGLSLAVVDGVLAATALEHGLTLVTRNAKDFAGFGLAGGLHALIAAPGIGRVARALRRERRVRTMIYI